MLSARGCKNMEIKQTIILINGLMRQGYSYMYAASMLGKDYRYMSFNIPLKYQRLVEGMKKHYSYWKKYYTVDELMPDYLTQLDAGSIEYAALWNMHNTTKAVVSDIAVES